MPWMYLPSPQPVKHREWFSTEAMAAGKPVVALDAPGVREMVIDTVNGRLLAEEDSSTFAGALQWVIEQSNGAEAGAGTSCTKDR